MSTVKDSLLAGVIGGSLVAGFLVGWAIWGGVESDAGSAEAGDSPAVPFLKAGRRATSSGVGGGAKDAFARLGDDWSGGMAGQLMGYLRHIRGLSVEELRGLIRRSEREFPGETPGAFVRGAIYRRMFEEDPEGLFEETMEGRSQYLTRRGPEIILKMAERDFDSTFERVREFPRLDQRANFVVALLGDLAKTEFDAAVALARGMQDVDEGYVLLRLAEEADAGDAAKAFDLALAAREHDRFARTIERLFEKWADGDRDAALARMESMPFAKDRRKAIRQIAATWGPEDLEGAESFATGIASKPERTEFLSALVWWADGEDRMRIAGAIPHAKMRDATMRDSLKHWYRRDAGKAEAWAEANGMSEALQDMGNEIEISGAEMIRRAMQSASMQ